MMVIAQLLMPSVQTWDSSTAMVLPQGLIQPQGSILPLAQVLSPEFDPPTRAVLVMALLAFVLLGIALVVGALLAGRWVRRLGGDDLRESLPLYPRANHTGDSTDWSPSAGTLRGGHLAPVATAPPNETQHASGSATTIG